jgi:hypothetical protein
MAPLFAPTEIAVGPAGRSQSRWLSLGPALIRDPGPPLWQYLASLGKRPIATAIAFDQRGKGQWQPRSA